MQRRYLVALGLLTGLPRWSFAAATADGGSLFSTAAPGAMPEGWARVPINASKRPTDYTIVRDGDISVLHADAKSAASMFMRDVSIDLQRTPRVHWRWKLGRLPTGADNAVASKEDSAARLVFAFGGDRSTLPFFDHVKMDLADSLSGQHMPYATLMYISSSVAPEGQRIENPHSRRVQMLVAGRAADALGSWQTIERDVVADYLAAFGEPLSRMVAYGVLTDSDNTRSEAEAWYGDIVFLPRA